ncbi:hypothetical protein FRC07_000450 [Ceratobasidium sp. 392]|nr:hypothetical protein FRC07_000450 [Ceratobasidium sp. 392]
MAQKSLFGPTVTNVPAGGTSSSSSSNVTVPRSAEIVKPGAQLLEQLLPVKTKPTAADPAASSGNTFVDALKKTQNQARTWNDAKAYKSTESATLDAFSGLNANSSTEDIHKLLAASWQESPELTLRIIWNMRSIHEGHSNKLGFYHGFGWLYKNHPRTAIENLQFVVERLCERKIKRKPKKDDGDFEIVNAEEAPTEELVKMPHGYYKDLLNLLVLALRNELGNVKVQKFESLNVPLVQRKARSRDEWKEIKEGKEKQNKELGIEEAKKLRGEESKKAVAAQAQTAKAERQTKRQADLALLKEKLEHDKPFLALYATVAQIFADNLANDVALLKRIEAASEEEAFNLKFELTSASKWAPTLEGFHDRATNISTAVAFVLHARGHMSDLSLSLSGEITQENAHVLRSYYRRWIVSPLRRFADVTEIKMSARQWDKVDYRHVPSECMKANKGHFFKHDEKRLTNYLADVATGKSKISGATLLPHELLIEALRANAPAPTGGKQSPEAAVKAEIARRLGESNKQVIEAQWNSLLERMRESGALESSLALVDVSGSMGSIGYSLPDKKGGHVQPIFPAVALGILLAQLAKPPFKDMFITFSATPELLTLKPGGLAEQAKWMVGTDWGMNTNYEAVFLKLLLPTAIANKVKPEDMVKRLFVFSDMQFDASLTDSSEGGWETTHDRMVKAYKEAGYEMPEIVYWNLQGGTTKPVLKDTPGTALLTGFSANMMKLFMEGDKIEEELTEIGPDGEEVKKKANDPLAVMEKSLSKQCYDTLKVYD